MRLLPLLIVALSGAFAASPAAASPLYVLDHGRVQKVEDPFLPASPLPVPPASAVPALPTPAPSGAKAQKSVASELSRLLAKGQISQATYDDLNDTLTESRATLAALSGTRKRELGRVISSLESFAARGWLTASRVRTLFLELDFNREWWQTGSLLGSGARVSVKPSRLILQYFPGQGLRFHPLANFGRVNGLLGGGFPNAARAMADELVDIGTSRGGGLAWEYYMYFGGGRPPWISAMAQGTAMQALTGISADRNVPKYNNAALAGLRAFEQAPPLGVRLGSSTKAHYLLYSFAPGQRVLNGFLQSVVGLHALADETANARATRLALAGDRQAWAELPRYDTGRWTRYQLGGGLASTNYHGLVVQFLDSLCKSTRASAYCRYQAKFARYLRMGYPPTPPSP